MAETKLKRKANEVDVLIGKNIGLFRTAKGISQAALARSVDIHTQMLQKYELGLNRTSASTLWRIAESLAIPIQCFFQHCPDMNTEPQYDVALAQLTARYHLLDEHQKNMFMSMAQSLIKTIALKES